jgi:hypothetical protein
MYESRLWYEAPVSFSWTGTEVDAPAASMAQEKVGHKNRQMCVQGLGGSMAAELAPTQQPKIV